MQDYLGQKPLVVDSSLQTGVRVRYDDPSQVGADRIVDAAAVHKLYGGPACVVDFGTATTFDAITAEGITWGCHRAGHRDRLGGPVPAGRQAAQG